MKQNRRCSDCWFHRYEEGFGACYPPVEHLDEVIEISRKANRFSNHHDIMFALTNKFGSGYNNCPFYKRVPWKFWRPK